MKHVYKARTKQEIVDTNIEWLNSDNQTMTGNTFCFIYENNEVEIIKVNNTWILKE